MSEKGVERERVTTNGLSFECLRRGDGDRLALCLHGFPDDAGTMRPLLGRLADAGFTAVAPYMRGYGPTDPAPGGDYTTGALATDAVALVEAFDAREPVLVGHDWGAAAGYVASRIAPERFSHLVALAVPPGFVDAIRDHPLQLIRSWYMGFFQLPGLPERVIRARDFAFIEWLWRAWSPGWDYPRERIEAVKATFRTPGTVEAALAYYRQFGRQVAEELIDERLAAAMDGPAGDGSGNDAAEEAPGGGIEVPGLVVAGKRDGCIGPALFENADAAFDARCRCIVVPGAGHFVHQERPDVVADEILDFVG